jgi:hypothetical protein
MNVDRIWIKKAVLRSKKGKQLRQFQVIGWLYGQLIYQVWVEDGREKKSNHVYCE